MLYDFCPPLRRIRRRGLRRIELPRRLKGWHKHGVCPRRTGPTARGRAAPGLRLGGTGHPQYPGVYYRIDKKSITDLQAAILEVGAVYVSAFTHDGWDLPGLIRRLRPVTARRAGHCLRRSAFPGGRSRLRPGGLQRARVHRPEFWGKDWGRGGFAVPTATAIGWPMPWMPGWRPWGSWGRPAG